jgi:hypothetical protein
LAGEELKSLGKLTSLTQILEVLSAPSSYRTYSIGVAMLARSIRELSGKYVGSVPQRFGFATAEELAAGLLTLFRKKGLLEKAQEFAVQRRAGSTREPQGRIWTYGGALLEELVRLDEELTRIARSTALEEHRMLVGTRSAISLRVGRRGRVAETLVVFSWSAQFSPVIRSTEVSTQRLGSDKLLDSIDDVHCTNVRDGSSKYLVVLTRAQIKRERAAAKLGKQTDRDIDRWTSDELDAVVLKDHLDENNEPLRFARDEILFVSSAYSSPVGVVQSSAGSGERRISLDTFETPKGVTVRRLTVDVDTELHDTLIGLVLKASAVRKLSPSK